MMREIKLDGFGEITSLGVSRLLETQKFNFSILKKQITIFSIS